MKMAKYKNRIIKEYRKCADCGALTKKKRCNSCSIKLAVKNRRERESAELEAMEAQAALIKLTANDDLVKKAGLII